MYTITYNLKRNENASESFYQDLEAYSHLVFKEMDELLYDALMGYFRYRRHEGLDNLYSHEEGYLEMLTLGVLWNVYSGDALATGESTNELLQRMVELRENNKRLKPIVDAFRGICLTFMMSPDLYDHMGVASPTRENFTKLLDWLEATGEFVYEVKRLNYWKAYLEEITEPKAIEILQLLISTGIWFEQDSLAVLGVYTENVERYLNELRPKHYWKEDVIFCGRRRVEYHLNMVASNWLNRAYKQSFQEKTKRIVFVPTCLKLLSNEDCQAETLGDWQVCKNCCEACQVSQLCQLEEEYNFKLYMLPHNASLKEKPENVDMDDVGVLGVACVLNLISGGWMLSERNIPAQCVMLDYCGCKGHWHHEGIPTSLDLNQFKRLLSRGL